MKRRQKQKDGIPTQVRNHHLMVTRAKKAQQVFTLLLSKTTIFLVSDFVIQALAPMLHLRDLLTMRSCSKIAKHSKWTIQAIGRGSWPFDLFEFKEKTYSRVAFFGLEKTYFLQFVQNLYIRSDSDVLHLMRVVPHPWPFREQTQQEEQEHEQIIACVCQIKGFKKEEFLGNPTRLTLVSQIKELDMRYEKYDCDIFTDWWTPNLQQRLFPSLFPLFSFSSALLRLKLPGEFVGQLIPGILPPCLQALEFNQEYDALLSLGTLPNSLTYLKFGDDYKQPLYVGVLPSSLKTLILGKRYNYPFVLGVLPLALETLVVGDFYNQQFAVNALPGSLLELSLGFCYSWNFLPLSLPPKLKRLHLVMGEVVVGGLLPASLETLLISIETMKVQISKFSCLQWLCFSSDVDVVFVSKPTRSVSESFLHCSRFFVTNHWNYGSESLPIEATVRKTQNTSSIINNNTTI